MNWHKLYLYICWLLPLFSLAQEDLFIQANTDFENQQFEQAISKYHKIEKEGNLSASLYYNMGTAYYYLQDTARSVLYLEKAAKIAPTDKEITHNLKLAYLQTHNEYEPVPPVPFIKKYYAFLVSMGAKKWLVVAFVGNVLFFTFLLLNRIRNKGLLKTGAILALIIGLLSFFFYTRQQKYLKIQNNAIVFVSKQTLKKEPNVAAEEVEKVYKGYKVELLDSLDAWYHVSFNDKEGWIERVYVEKI